MKILKIKFKNINSFYQKLYTIDFTQSPLSDTHLFIISGPTGAGKSTLLDVITLALYNRIPRFKKISISEIDSLGSIVNSKAIEEPRCEAYAEVEYEVRSGRYRSCWSIAKNRNGNWNDYQMEIAKLPDETLLDIKSKVDIPKKNAELIGLTYEQFVKSIILAQGSFAEFLKADRFTRAKLLEDLTGTQIYRQLGISAFERSKTAAKQVELKEAEQKGVVLKSTEELETLKAKKELSEHRRSQLEAEVEKWEREAKVSSDIRELEISRTRIQADKQRLLQEEEKFRVEKSRLQDHERVSHLVAPMTRFVEFQKQKLQLEDEFKKTRQNSEHHFVKRSELLRYASELTGLPLKEDELTKVVNEFEHRVVQLELTIGNLKAQAQPLKDSLRHEYARAEYEWVTTLPFQDLRKTFVQLKSKKEQLAALLEAFPTDFKASESLRELDEKILLLAELKKLILDRDRIGAEGKKTKSDLALCTESEVKLVPKLENVRKVIAELTKKIEEYGDKLLYETTKINLEDQRKKLKEGEPCPLCGSTHHPYLHTYINNVSELGQKLKDFKDELAAKQNLEKETLLNLETARKKKVELSDRLTQMRLEYRTIEQQIKALTLQWGGLDEHTVKAIDQQLGQIQKEKANIDRWVASRDQMKLASRLLENVSSLESIDQELARLEGEKQKIYKGKDVRADVKSLLRNWEQVLNAEVENQRQSRLLQEKLKNLETELHTLKSELESALIEKGIESLEVAQRLLLDPKVYEQLKREQDRLQEWAGRLATQETENEKSLAEKIQQRLYPEMVFDEVRDRLTQLKTAFHQTVAELATIENEFQNDAQQRAKFEAIQLELGLLKKESQKWELLAKYIGDAKGNRFSSFAQSLTLKNLIGLANARLQNFSDRYLLDKPKSDSDHLFVLDTYYGNSARSTSTLSGGETFTVSLALALALSDLASRNVKIESLFIDEGFGTLDGEMLESAVTILEKMQDESSKLVGVISHRQEMKERIPVQILVDKAADGTSSIDIRG